MNEIPSTLAEQLGDVYELRRVIGRGGMATVYLARDLRHDREVAIKVMRDDLSSALVAERFLREIRISASLTHPHILTLIDSGEAAGLLYYVTPFIDGESLRTRLLRNALDIETAFRLTAEIGDALSYAHRKDIIHRDIKPENILMAEGHAVVADFGIARAISRASDEHLTRTGFPLGTVGYMSPEQAAGGMDLTCATDVYSLACVCYEMIVGVPPGRWMSESEINSGRFAVALPEQRGLLDALPSHSEQAMLRAMAVRLDLRFETATSFCKALNNPGAGRVYHTTEVDDIIGDAASLQADEPTPNSGMSLRTIQDLGAEVGIPSSTIRKAAATRVGRQAGTASRETGFLNWPLKIVAERQVAGEIYGSDYVFALEDIRQTIDEPGQASTLGNAFEWRTSNAGMAGMRDVQVSIIPRTGSTYVSVREKIRSNEVLTAITGFGVATVIGAAAVGTVGITWAFPAILAVGGVLLAGAKTWFDRTTSKKERALADLADRLADHIRESRSRI